MAKEIEVKVRVSNLPALSRKLRSAGFRLLTPRTREINTLYDLPGQKLRKRKELLRIRQYGSEWLLTHKSGNQQARHSSRVEIETRIENGKKMDAILRSLGYAPSFRYEKFRAEWAQGKGKVVLDETPIGNFCEIEGPPRWIDSTANVIGVDHKQYITKNYATLFVEWKQQHRSAAPDMTFSALRRS